MTDLEAPPVSPARAGRAGRIRRAAAGFGRQLIVEPVAAGRLRDEGWPYGLRAIVTAAYVMFGLAALGVIWSGPIRAHSTLTITGTGVLGLPSGAVWPLVVLFSFALACLLSAAQHGPWWLKLLGLSVTLAVTGQWALRSPSLAGGVWAPALGVAALVALTGFFLARWRRAYAWWEFVVGWALIGGVLVLGVVESRTGQVYGNDFNPLYLQLTAAQLGYLALPSALVAGAAVAEITVRASVAAVGTVRRLRHRRWPYVVLAVVVALRVFQGGWFWLTRDPVRVGPAVLGIAGVTVVLLGAVGAVLLRLGRHRVLVTDLGDEVGSVGFVVAVVLAGMALPVQAAVAVLTVVTAVSPSAALSSWFYTLTPLFNRAVDPARAMLGAVLVAFGVRAARRGRTARALMLGSVGVMLIVLARQLVLGSSVSAPINPDVLSLLSSGVVVIVIAVMSVRRRLTARRALAYASVLILSALFAYREFVADPVGYLLGFSGAALVLIGLTWDLLTGAGWGNGSSRRFPRPTRVLLVLTNAVLTMSVLAYAALVRDGSTTIYLDPYAELGDLVLGTALLGAAVVACLDAAARDVDLG